MSHCRLRERLLAVTSHLEAFSELMPVAKVLKGLFACIPIQQLQRTQHGRLPFHGVRSSGSGKRDARSLLAKRSANCRICMEQVDALGIMRTTPAQGCTTQFLKRCSARSITYHLSTAEHEFKTP